MCMSVYVCVCLCMSVYVCVCSLFVVQYHEIVFFFGGGC